MMRGVQTMICAVLAWLASAFRHLVASVLRSRPVPKHIAFIMDGNRRYAENQRLQAVQGHTFGYNRLIDALQWCLDLGVQAVSVYAFSIDNYQRSPEEVATLMQLAEDKLAHMLEEEEFLRQHGVQVRVIGDLHLAPPGVQTAAARIMQATAAHSGAVLNICFSYTSSREMQQALEAMASSNRSNTNIGSGSSSPWRRSLEGSSLDEYLHTAGCPPVDLVVRTSGETRLSDFMLWQSRHALLVFSKVLWPNFSFLDLVHAVMRYQHSMHDMHRLQQCYHEAAAAAAVEAAAAVGQRTPGADLPLHLPLPGSLNLASQPNFSLPLNDLEGSPALLLSIKTPGGGSPCGIVTPQSAGSSSSSSPSLPACDELEQQQQPELLEPRQEQAAAALRRRAAQPEALPSLAEVRA